MSRQRPTRAIPLNCRALAKSVGCSYQTVVRITGDLAASGRRTVWAWQAYGFMIFERHRPHATARCGHPQLWLINRHGMHRIGGAPGKVRARLRQKEAWQWKAYLDHLKKLTWGQFLRGSKRANDKHKGSPERETGGVRLARPPPTANRPGLRRFQSMAGHIQNLFNEVDAAPRIDLHRWALLRLGEWQHRDRIMACLRHAVGVMPGGRYAPVNPAAWVCAVASRHLEGDGLAAIQRRRSIQEEGRKRQPAVAGGFKGSVLKSDFIDSDGRRWQHLGGTNWREIL